MQRQNEGKETEHCQHYAWEMPGEVCVAAAPTSKCPECNGEGSWVKEDDACNAVGDPCDKCGGTGLGEKPQPGELCHQVRPECLSYRPTLMFSCGEGGD